MMMNHVNESRKNFKQLLSDARKGRTARVMIDGAEKLKSILREAKTRGASPAYLERLKNDGRAAILADIVTAGLEERERLTKQLDDVRNRWTAGYERNFQLHAFRHNNLEFRYRSMSSGDLRKLAAEFPKTNHDDPAETDILLSALISASELDVADNLRSEMNAKYYAEPWRSNDEGKLIAQELTLNQHVADGAMIADAEGRTVGISLDELLADDDTDEEDEE